jgi:hypothetical protein
VTLDGDHSIVIGDYVSVHGMDDADYDSYNASPLNYHCDVTAIPASNQVTYTHPDSLAEASTAETSGKLMCSKWKKLRFGMRMGCEIDASFGQDRITTFGFQVDNMPYRESAHAVAFYYLNTAAAYTWYATQENYRVAGASYTYRYLLGSLAQVRTGSANSADVDGAGSQVCFGTRAKPRNVYFQLDKATGAGKMWWWANYHDHLENIIDLEADFEADLVDATAFHVDKYVIPTATDEHVWENATKGPFKFIQFGWEQMEELEIYDMGWAIIA